MGRTVRCLRDFLVQYAHFCRHHYNDMCGFYLWKVLFACLSNNPDEVNWEDLIHVFQLNQWEVGDFGKIKLRSEWRDSFLPRKKPDKPKGTQCAKQCYGTETVYYCFDCTRNPLYEICQDCFDESQHEGHRYTSRIVTRPEGKVCQCTQKSHTESVTESEFRTGHDNENHILFNDDENYNDNWINTFSQVLDFIIDCCFACSDADENIKHSDVESVPLRDSDGAMELFSHKYVLVMYKHECSIHIQDVTRKLAETLKKNISYGTFVLSQFDQDDHFTIVAESPNKESMLKLKDLLDSQGIPTHVMNQSNAFKKHMISELSRWLNHFTSYHPSVLTWKQSLRLSFLDQYSSSLLTSRPFKINVLGNFVVSSQDEHAFPWIRPWNFSSLNEHHDPRILNVMDRYDQKVRETNTPNSSCRFSPLSGSRFQFFLTECFTTFSSLTRIRLVETFGAIFSLTDDSKKCLAAQYLDVYCNILYQTIKSDFAGYKLTLMSTLSQYVFPSSSIANMIINSGFIQRSIHFTFSIMSIDTDLLSKSSPISFSMDFKLPNTVIKNKKSVICFKDIYQVMCTNTIPEAIFANESLVNTLTECFYSFNTILPLNRETSEHIQYESFDFSSFYFFFSSVLIMIDGFLRNISLIMNSSTRSNVVTSLLRTSIDRQLRSLDKFRPKFHEDGSPFFRATVCNVQTQVFNFRVGSDTQNFFNPISYYIKFILQWCHCGRYEPIPDSLKKCFSFSDFFHSSSECLSIAEPALCTLVLISQIEAGFWVRNGTPVQHQSRMYTKYSMREYTYFSDFFHVQFSMCYADPHDFMVTFITRWGLKNWAEGIPIGDYPEESLTIAMAEQCILTLIRLLTEVRALCISSSVEGFESTMKSEIIHSLCFRNSSYSSLIDSIPEHITKHPAFDLYLNQYSDFHDPTGPLDNGTYSLKKQYRKSIDPFFVGFSSNKRYEASLLVRERMKNQHGVNFNDTFVPAKVVSKKLLDSQYFRLYQISSTDIFGLFLKNSLVHVVKMNAESLLAEILHLIHLCVVNNLTEFEKVFWREYHLDESENGFYHSIGSLLYYFLSSESFGTENGKVREIFRHLKDKAPHINVHDYLSEQTPNYDSRLLFSDISESENDEHNKKKMLAKSRREKLMLKLARQQKEFMDNHNVSTEEVSSQGLSIDTSGLDLTWKYTEDDCVFCKMPKEYDVLSYFVFIERNIIAVNLKDDKTKDVTFGPVLSTCGHCGHYGCLLTHMKSIRKTLGQITKNVRDGFGLSSINCSLCNSVVNAFIPLLKGNRSCADYNTKNVVTRHSLVLITELCGMKFSVQNGFVAGCVLFANTISNLELTLRDDRNRFIIKKLTTRHLMTLRLIADLLNYGLEKRVICTSAHKLRDPFLSFCASIQVLVDQKTIIDVLRAKLIEELTERVNEIIKLCYSSTSVACEGATESSFPHGDVLSQIIITRIHFFSTSIRGSMQQAERVFRENEGSILNLLMTQIVIFLRKACIALQGHSSSSNRTLFVSKGPTEVETMLEYCELPTFMEILQELFSSHLNGVGTAKHLKTSLGKPRFPVVSPFIDFPSVISSLSSMSDSDFNLRFRAFKEDVAICMFCGETCVLQKPSLLHFSRIGQCTNHYYNQCKFKSPYGCFFILKSNIIYLSYGNKGSFYKAPYVNKHGETDDDYKLGTPVTFSESRFRHFVQDVVIPGKIPHFINRANDKTADIGGWESM